ncbi:MAG: hypothetical protein K1X64_18845 [Myxococcaceae bacterium]|nr:hypothetical protein [Myxococcaceae bacterium]
MKTESGELPLEYVALVEHLAQQARAAFIETATALGHAPTDFQVSLFFTAAVNTLAKTVAVGASDPTVDRATLEHDAGEFGTGTARKTFTLNPASLN